MDYLPYQLDYYDLADACEIGETVEELLARDGVRHLWDNWYLIPSQLLFGIKD